MDTDTNANTDSTQMNDSVAEVSQTEDALLADIMRNTEFLESLPDKQVPPVDTDESDQQDPNDLEEADNEEVEEEIEEEVEVVEEEDADEESATDESEIISMEDLDLEAKTIIKVDGENVEVSFGDLIKGYSTEQHLSKKGRELGDARKELEEEYNSKLAEINGLSEASAAVLYQEESQLAKQYHDIESQIEKARDEGDTYEVNELKDKREQVQKKYWDSRNKREGIVKTISTQREEENNKAWQTQLEYFNETIPTLIPDFNEETAMQIREFAIDEGIAPEVLDTIADPIIVKFVDDYRRLKQGVTKGAAKRKETKVKTVPVRKAKPASQKRVEKQNSIRDKALSGNASQSEQMDFLKTLAERSLNR
jgi:hypothetical protein